MKNAVFWNVTCLAFVRTDVSEELIAYIIRAERLKRARKTLAETTN
jgi:hypothetical protein